MKKTDILYKPGSIHLLIKKGERRASGSYYTPDHIVDYLVKNTLAPVCQQIDFDLKNDIHELELSMPLASEEEKLKIIARIDELKSDFDNRVLNLKILDPAMGSDHFLLKACQYLAEEIATHPYAKDEEYDESIGDESSITF